jgi:hypothetical protein
MYILLQYKKSSTKKDSKRRHQAEIRFLTYSVNSHRLWTKPILAIDNPKLVKSSVETQEGNIGMK